MVETFDCNNIRLKEGDKGAKVTLLQKHLKTLGYYTYYKGHYLMIDGVFGPYTSWALRRFQSDTGHSADAVFGEKTCPSLNEKILKHYGETASTPSPTPSTEKKTATVTTTVAKPKVDPYAPNTKNNIFPNWMANLNIDGILLVASSVTRTTPYNSGDWKNIGLMNGKNYFYKDRPVPREFSVDCYVFNEEFPTINVELTKMAERICNVVSTQFPSGKYVVKVSIADEKVNSKKITLKFTEYLV